MLLRTSCLPDAVFVPTTHLHEPVLPEPTVPFQFRSPSERIMLTKTDYIQTCCDSLRALETEIDRLANYANAAAADVAAAFSEAIVQLQLTRARAIAKRRELQMSNGDTWKRDDATVGVEAGWNDLRNAVLIAISTTYCEANHIQSGHPALDHTPLHRLRSVSFSARVQQLMRITPLTEISP